jgi:predicted chitinase
MITKDLAERFFSNTITDTQLSDLNSCLITYGIDKTKARLNHFLAQIAHESGGLQWMAELASGADYEWRLDLGNTKEGDGRKYKGAGAIQLTGRANYQDFANYLKKSGQEDPRVMEGWTYVSQVYPFTSAGFWWLNNNMNALVDKGATVKEVTRRVNGGYNGLDDRVQYYFKAVDLFSKIDTPFKKPIPEFINEIFKLGQ